MLIWQENFYFVYFGRQICLRERRRLKNFQNCFQLEKVWQDNLGLTGSKLSFQKTENINFDAI